MAIKIIDASKDLKIHPMNLILALSHLVPNLDDCWPEVDEGFIETIKPMNLVTASRSQSEKHVSKKEETATIQSKFSVSVSEGAARIVDKLERTDRWAGNRISWDTLRNHYCQAVRNIEEAAAELKDKELILVSEG